MRLLAGGVSLAFAAALYLLWPASEGESSDDLEQSTTVGPALASVERLRRDAHGLARAFSLVAARTMGTVIIAGQVRDRLSGQPIPNAEVIFTGPSGESSAQCDGDGRYRAELLPGFYRGYAQAEGFVAVARATAKRLPGPVSAASVALPRSGIAPLVGVFRDEQSVHFNLTPAGRIVGRVLDRDGRAISGAIVAGRASGDMQVISGSDVTESDGSGAYELLIPAGVIYLEASHDQFAGVLGEGTIGARQYAGPGEIVERDIKLVAGCIVEGTVVDAEGNLLASGAFERRRLDGSYGPIGEIKNGVVRFATGLEGEFALRAWPWKSPPSEDQVFQCTGGAHFTQQTFVIPSAAPALTGTVTDSGGEPVPFAFVDLFGLEAGGATQQERTDALGDFAFYVLPHGLYQLSAYVPGKGATMQLANVPSTGIPLDLGGVGSVVGSISGFEEGSFSMKYRCVFDFGDGESARADEISMPLQSLLVPVSSGKFRIDDLPACSIIGLANAPNWSQAFSITVTRNQDSILRLSTN